MQAIEETVKKQKQGLSECISEQVSITDTNLNDITAHFEPLNLEAGEKFAEPGRLCRKMAYIHSGVMRMYNFAEGKEITLWIGSKNRFITDLRSFIHKEPGRWFIEAVEPAQLMTITRENHYSLIRKYHEWIEFDNRLLTSAYTIIEDRMFSHLHMSADERYKKLFDTEPELFNKVPLKQIASMLAMTPETLSRLRAKKSS
jgi:CRP-like cAMP-binding protein